MHQSPPEINSVSDHNDTYQTLDDAALMGLVSGGNQSAFAEIVLRHTRSALNLARRTTVEFADAEDVVQSVFIKLWQNPQSWKADKSAFSTWLYRVVLNACYDLQRKRRWTTPLDSAAEPQTVDVAEQHAEQQIQVHRHEIIVAMIAELPPKQRDAINLAIYLALPQKQVAAIMGISVKAVESLLVRAKKALQHQLNVTHVNENKSDNRGMIK